MRVLAFVSALLCVGCISTQALTSLGDIDIDITREFNYKDQEEADANPLPKEIEENGNTYVLDEDSVDYQQRELNTKYQETVEYTDLTVKEVPQTYTVTLGGEQYELPLEDVQYTEEQADIPTKMTVEYKGEDKKPNAPQNKTFTLDDGTEVEGVLKEVNEVEDTDTWVDFTIDGQVVIPEGATAYVYLGKVHTYNPATPLWDGYKSDLMSAIGLNSDSYKITGGKWTSDPVARAEGGFYRTLSFYGQKNTGKSYVAVYETAAPIEIKYVASATYSMSLLSIGLDESFGNASELKVSIIGGDASGVSGVSGNVPVLMAQTMQTVKEATGIDMADIVRANSINAKTDRNINIHGLPAIEKVDDNAHIEPDESASDIK